MAINERQLKLYNYLLNQDTWVNRIDILRDLKSDYNFHDYGDLYHNPSAVLLTRDLHVLNNDPDIRKLIIHNSSKGIKIADEKESSIYLNKNLAEALKKLQQYQFLRQKTLTDGQVSMVGEDLKVLETFRR